MVTSFSRVDMRSATLTTVRQHTGHPPAVCGALEGVTYFPLGRAVLSSHRKPPFTGGKIKVQDMKGTFMVTE